MNQDLDSNDQKPDLSAKGVWQCLTQESHSAYSAFVLFLELGADATLQQVAEKLGRSFDAVRQLSRRHHWMERAAAYRQHVSNASLLAAESQHAKQAELLRMRDRFFRQQLWETSQTLLIACQRSLNTVAFDEKEQIPSYQLANMINLCLRLGTRANEPTQFTCEGAPSTSLDFDEAVKMVYGENLTLEKLLELAKSVTPFKPPTPPETGSAPTNPGPDPTA